MKNNNSDYVASRDYVINEIINNVRIAYGGTDDDILSGVGDLTTTLQCADPAPEFVADLKGFMLWARMTNQPRRAVLTTLIHDLREFSENRHQKWFCPRTTGYSKYLTGV